MANEVTWRARFLTVLVVALMVLWPPVPPSRATSASPACNEDFSIPMSGGIVGIGLQGTSYTQCVSIYSQQAYIGPRTTAFRSLRLEPIGSVTWS